MTSPLLELRRVGKSYESNRVLSDVSLSVRPGTIHALVGENGAGKSTLMNILFGMSVIHETGGYDGQVLLEGREVRFGSPTEAMAAGPGMGLLEVMRTLAAKGLGLLFITHRLDEVLAVADEITVLRDGGVVGQLDPRATTVVQIAELMVGRPAAVRSDVHAAAAGGGTPSLTV